MRFLAFVALFVLAVSGVFPQTFIPDELLRPRRGEDPRYPIDTVIGELGQGQASKEAYDFARRAAAALLAGDMDVSVLSRVNRPFLEGCMSMLETVNPRSFRLGSGREEPDGSVSFLVRFIGREQGITGELFIRFEERRPNPPPQVIEENPADITNVTDVTSDTDETTETTDGQEDVAAPEPLPPPPPVIVPVERFWVFEDLILEEPRSREEENQNSRHRFDFPPYERFF